MMTRNLLLSVLAVLGMVACVHADHHEEEIHLIGEWRFEIAKPDGEGTATWTINKVGNKLTGNAYDHDADVELSFDRIVVDGKKATVEVDMERNGNELLIRAEVEQSTPNTLNGELNVTGEDGTVLMTAGLKGVRVLKYAGEWNAVSVLPNGRDVESILTLEGKNDELKGQIDGRSKADLDTVTAKDGTLKVEFELKMQGFAVPVVINAKPNGANQLTGKWSLKRPNGKEVTGDWKAVRKSSPAKKGGWNFVHLFYMKFKEGVSDEEMADLMKQLASMKSQIPELQEFVIGKNVAPRTNGYQYGLIAVFDKPEDLEIYERHPEHQKLVKKIIPKLDHGVTMDFTPLVSNNSKTDSSNGTIDLKGKFIHAFCFKFKPEASEEKVDGLMQELADSRELIPVLRELVVGKNVARNHHGFTYGEIAVFDKPEGEHDFQKHPEHRKLVPKIIPNMAKGITLDFVPLEN